MCCRVVFALLAVFVGYDIVSAQQIPSTTTAAELWNPWTWFWPYAIATAEGYRDYYEKAQKATNELYQQIYKTNAFPWITGNWGIPSQNNQGGGGGQTNQNNTGESGGQTNQNNPGESGGQSNQENQEGTGGQADQENSTQSNQENSENPGQGTTEEQQSQTDAEPGTGTQVQGNVQNDGTADANANIDGKEIQV